MATVQEILRRVGVPRERGVTDLTEQTETINEIIKCLTALRDTTEPRPMPTPFERRIEAATSHAFGPSIGLKAGQGELLGNPVITPVRAQGNVTAVGDGVLSVSVKNVTRWRAGSGTEATSAYTVYLMPAIDANGNSWGDWNVTTGNILGVIPGDDEYPVIGIWPGYDAPIGTIKMLMNNVADYPQGWRLLDAAGSFPLVDNSNGSPQIVPEVKTFSHTHAVGINATVQSGTGASVSAVANTGGESVTLNYFPPYFTAKFLERYHVGT
jgi:hypothetical protein